MKAYNADYRYFYRDGYSLPPSKVAKQVFYSNFHECDGKQYVIETFFQGVVDDILFIPLFLLITITGWRRAKLWNYITFQRELYAVVVEENKYSLSGENQSRKTSNKGMSVDEIMYMKILFARGTLQEKLILKSVAQLWYLFIDVLTLLPFGAILLSLYRLPSLIANFYAKLSAKAILDKRPLFQVKSFRMVFPEMGGPKLRLTLLPWEDGSDPAINGKTKTKIEGLSVSLSW